MEPTPGVQNILNIDSFMWPKIFGMMGPGRPFQNRFSFLNSFQFRLKVFSITPLPPGHPWQNEQARPACVWSLPLEAIFEVRRRHRQQLVLLRARHRRRHVLRARLSASRTRALAAMAGCSSGSGPLPAAETTVVETVRKS